jgi:phenylacetate-CoA ligase
MNTTPIIENNIWQPEFECMRRDDLEALQVQRLQKAVQRASILPFYQEALLAEKLTADSIRSLDDLRRLPMTTKADLRDNYPLGFMGVTRNEIARYQGTSGTTGKPTWVAYTQRDVVNWGNLCARFLVAGGLKREHTVQLSFGFG